MVLAGCLCDRGDARFGGEVVFGDEAGGIVAELGGDLGGADLAGAWEGHDDAAGGERWDGVLDGAGEMCDLGDERLEDGDEGAHGVGLRVGGVLAGEPGGCAAQAREQLGHRPAPAVAMAGEEGGEALLAEMSSRLGMRVAAEEGQGDRRVDVGEDGCCTRPEALEQGPELVGEDHAFGDEIVACSHESAQRLDLVGEGLQRAEAVAIGAQQVREQIGIAAIALAGVGAVARARRSDDVGVDRNDGMPGLDERVDEQARGPLDRDRQLGGRSVSSEPAAQLGKTLGVVRDLEAIDDGSLLVDHAHGVRLAGPIDPDESAHGRSPLLRVTTRGAGRSCRSLIGRRSHWTSALHPVAGRDLLASAPPQVSHGPSRSQRAGQSEPRRNEPRPPRLIVTADDWAEVVQ